MKTTNSIEIHGSVETIHDHDKWLGDFIDWLESRNETFGGGTSGDSDNGGGTVQVSPVVSHRRKKR